MKKGDLAFVATGGTPKENDEAIKAMIASLPLTEEGREFLAKLEESQREEQEERRRVAVLEAEHAEMLHALIVLKVVSRDDIEALGLIAAISKATDGKGQSLDK